VVNALLLPLHLVLLLLLGRDATIMKELVLRRPTMVAGWVSVLLVVACVITMTVAG
jgi:Mn2+/Fe2+ NRAMP family transporter